MKNIAIYGAGGFGREVYCLIQRINAITPTWNVIGFFDDGKEIGSANEYGKVLGGIDELNAWPTTLAIIISIGSPKLVEKIVSKIENPIIDFPNIIAPDTIIIDPNNISFGKGNLICTGCLFSCNVNIGNFNTFNGFVTVGHDASFGDFNSVMPAVRISGEVNVGNRNFLGVSSVVLQQIKIGNDTVIGANSTILRRTKDGYTYVGNPATIVKY
ncbi:sugar O-acyltransferase, sialic acid O-acetyltransferase NeuD family [Bacteroides luti]|uniref:Sugar O-acyltransferase, sialic acid O-acetyltransferase NeuD family n=1 Tax=Bacteroides luti TaxID=1297750 RepID=A0A1M4WIZ6_9BACE|nr:NeuD/PglB/VioB family sugar acetyltransferase [Bacteroides luti]SHE80952.1 sugar O-acyltransferase, sialic acid O-acetyltransferase NeuD family [Bacteroides luti]